MMLYRNQVEALEELPPEQFKAAMMAICRYALDDIEPDGDPIVVAIWKMCKPLIDKNNKNYENGKRRYVSDSTAIHSDVTANRSEPTANRSEPTAIHSEPTANPQRIEATAQRIEANPQPNVKCKMLNTKESTPDGVLKKSAPRFVPPSREDVAEYVAEKGYSVDPDSFIDFYTSKGWMVGKNPMKDWKAAVRNWNRTERKDFAANSSYRREDLAAKGNKFRNYDQRQVDYDSLIARGDYS